MVLYYNCLHPDVIRLCILSFFYLIKTMALSLAPRPPTFDCCSFIRVFYVCITTRITPFDNAISFPTVRSSGPKRMGISNTAECEAADGSCSLRADCDLSVNMFRGMCDNTNFGCCISNDVVCAARNGTCLSEVDCEADDDNYVSRMACSSDAVCCMPNN